MNCDGRVNLGDAIFIARYLVELSNNTGPQCPSVGDAAVQSAGVTIDWGDVDCSQQFNLGDSIILARYLVNLTNQPAGCPAIGENRVLMTP